MDLNVDLELEAVEAANRAGLIAVRRASGYVLAGRVPGVGWRPVAGVDRPMTAAEVLAFAEGRGRVTRRARHPSL